MKLRGHGISGRGEHASKGTLAPGDDRVATEAGAQLGEPVGSRGGRVGRALGDLGLDQQLQRRGALEAPLLEAARASAQNRRGLPRLAPREVDRSDRDGGGGVVLEALDQALRLLDAPLGQAQLGELGQGLAAECALGGR